MQEQKVGQRADIANKAYSRFCARLRRIGHDKPGKQMSAMDVSKLDETTQALYKIWQESERELEAAVHSDPQFRLGVTFDDNDPPDDERDARIAAINERIEAETEGYEQLFVSAEKFAELMADALPNEAEVPYKAKPVELFDRKFVIVGAFDPASGVNGALLLNRVVHNNGYEGDREPEFSTDEHRAKQRGVMVVGPGNQKWFTTGDPAVVLIRDPLAAEMQEDAEVDKPKADDEDADDQEQAAS